MRQDSITPKNLAGTQYFNMKTVTVAEYHELPNGEGPPTEVHLAIDVDGIPYPFIVRWHSRRPIDELIVALITHANRVWPKAVDK
jgi:hypothetical protein